MNDKHHKSIVKGTNRLQSFLFKANKPNQASSQSSTEEDLSKPSSSKTNARNISNKEVVSSRLALVDTSVVVLDTEIRRTSELVMMHAPDRSCLSLY